SVAQCAHLGADDLGERAASRAEHWSAREERLDGGETERLVPQRGHPQTARAGEELRLLAAVHGTRVADPTPEARAPAPGDHQPSATPLGALDGPAIPFRAVQPPEEEVVVGLGRAEDIVARVESVVDEHVAAEPPCVVT